MRWLILSVLIAIAGLWLINWRVQLQTQQKLDVMNAAIAERRAVSAPIAQPKPPIPTPEPVTIPKEPTRTTQPPYIIESPDVLCIEVVVHDSKMGKDQQLTEQAVSGPFPV